MEVTKKRKRTLTTVYDHMELWLGIDGRSIELKALPNGEISVLVVETPGTHVVTHKVLRSDQGLKSHLSRLIKKALVIRGE